MTASLMTARAAPLLPAAVWLCPAHGREFWMPHGGTCPVCPLELVEYAPAAPRPEHLRAAHDAEWPSP